ncbi:Citrate synthase 1 [Shimia sp. SK013]|uniref:citryl-CoA lyase n=1 Tax=Shimia sp. SK013 TaxID=1389006 RepID=UPI0006B40519|nr:citryl-CoA lyase [Shimia sp. SK013]KPA20213.1 Citrate synthase 1 [Shimia sp. SK013]
MMDPSGRKEAEDWWQTALIRMEPNQIDIRGRPIQDLIGTIGFVDMIWLCLRGDLPSEGQARLLEAALTAAVDHGPQAPSIAAARMAATCGVGLNSAMATGINMLGDVHGGAGEQAVSLYRLALSFVDEGDTPDAAAGRAVEHWTAHHGKYMPGFGHRFHTRDPRAPRLMELVKIAQDNGVVSGGSRDIAQRIEEHLSDIKGRAIPMNIDGATAVIYAELGFEAPLARGLFCLSRSVGILAHAWEQTQQGGRNKGPLPKGNLWTYLKPSEK